MGKLFVKGYTVPNNSELYNLDYVGSVRRGNDGQPDRFCLAETYDKNGSWVKCGDGHGHSRFEECVVEINAKWEIN